MTTHTVRIPGEPLSPTIRQGDRLTLENPASVTLYYSFEYPDGYSGTQESPGSISAYSGSGALPTSSSLDTTGMEAVYLGTTSSVDQSSSLVTLTVTRTELP